MDVRVFIFRATKALRCLNNHRYNRIKLADSVPLSLCQTETGNLQLDSYYTMLSSCLHEYLHAHRYTHILLIFTFYYCSFKKYCLLKIGGFENPLARKFENNLSASELQ